MSDAQLAGQRLTGLSPKAYQHPADRAATAALAAIPMLDTVVRKLVELGYERAMRQTYLAGSVRLGPEQLPTAWADHVAACVRLDLTETPDLHVVSHPDANAMTFGAGRPMVILHSRLVELLDTTEMRTVLGHEAGHVASEHVLYSTALGILTSLTGAVRLPVLGGLPLLAVRYALMEWYRAAELTCDRAATLVNRDPLATCRTLMVLSAGLPSSRLDVDAFMAQARDHDVGDEGWDRLSRLRAQLSQSHDYPVRRAREVMRWVQSGEYDRIVGGEYRTRDQEAAHPREEAADAVDLYTERFRTLFREVGGGVEKAGGSFTEATERLSDWLRR